MQAQITITTAGNASFDARRVAGVAGVAAVTGLALLSAFVHVVAQGVHQGQQRRAAVAAQEQMLWRCNALPRAELRLECLRQVPTDQPLQIATGPLT